MAEKKADLGGKRLISLAPNPWARWVTQLDNLVVQEILSSNFQWIARESDVILKVRSPSLGDFLLLNELQLRYRPNLPQRIRAYAALAEERYNLPVYPVLINILPSAKTQRIPQRYQSEILGVRAYQDYRVINLWEIDASRVFEKKLVSLLPFTPILKGGNEETIVRQSLQELRANEELRDLEPLLSFFASFVLEIPVVQQIMRWDMTVLRESPWYQEILKEGLQQEGVTLVSRQLSRRFGELSSERLAKIQPLSTSQLEQLAEDLLDFSRIEDLDRWLAQPPTTER